MRLPARTPRELPRFRKECAVRLRGFRSTPARPGSFTPWSGPRAASRAYRIGQTRNVQVHKFLCSGTLEEQIDGILEGKQVVGTGEGWLTELSNAALREVLALRPEAVLAEGASSWYHRPTLQQVGG